MYETEEEELNRSTLPIGLGKLYKYWISEEKNLDCSLSFQRHANQWNNITKSNLVASLLSDSYVPPIVLLKDKLGVDAKGKDVFKYQILDGQQRLTTLFDFMSEDGFQLHGSTEPVEYDGFTYDISGKRFGELEEELQDAIKGYRFNIQCLENYTFPEVERLFFNINSGVSLSTVQKAKSRLGNDNMTFFNELLSGVFFTQAINITEAQARREDDLCLLLQTMLLLDNRHENYEYKNISTATCLSYAESIRDTYNADKKEVLSGLAAYLDEAFPQKVKFLRKNNVPVVGVCAKIAMEQGVDAASFKAFINDFSNGVYPAYEEASGSGNIKAPKVQMRLRVMFLAMCDYFHWSSEEVPKPFAENIPLKLDVVENTEVTDNILSVSEDTNADEENGEGVGEEAVADEESA